jgi:hypothetical protein
LKYHPCAVEALTVDRYPATGQWLVGSLTGAVASENVTEAPKGHLRPNGNRPYECKGIRWLYCETDMSSSCESRA